MPSTSPPQRASPFGDSSTVLTAESLVLVRDPLRWPLALGCRAEGASVQLRAALGGPRAQWTPPSWLLPHQIDAARRIAGALEAFRAALLCDAVGLGKTYVALAVAMRYRRPVSVVPAVLRDQWRRTAARFAIPLQIVSHESLSHGTALPPGDFYVVDEAHRFRNAGTARYDRLARGLHRSPVLFVTATPVVNTPADLAHLLRLSCSDHAFASLGIDSLEAQGEKTDHLTFARCILPLVVSRTALGAGLPDGAVPQVRDVPIVTAATLPPPLEHRVIDAIQSFRFPTFESRSAADLLRLHLLHRLSSSVAACAVTLRRHATYLERAIARAHRGERLTRRAARRLFEPDDEHQLDFPFSLETPAPIDPGNLEAELCRVRALRDVLTGSPPDNDKLRALRQILEAKPTRQTIVFVGSTHTGLDIARAMGWRNVVTVSGRGARIASGRLPVREALALFAPRARGAAPPHERSRATVLIATDLVSEGLDLQDAQQVVHYDLPWTPLRLQQRVGRAARLGSTHRHVTVCWFAPTAALDHRLKLRERLARKAHWQRDLAVAVSSRLGESHVVGHCLSRRETLARVFAHGNGPDGASRSRAGPLHTVVHGPRIAAIALDWQYGGIRVPVVVVLAGTHWRPVQRIDEWLAHVETLLDGPVSPYPVPSGLERALERFVRGRLGAALAGPRDTETLALARHMVQMARAATASRATAHLPELERALDQLIGGVTVGTLRTLRSAVRSHTPWAALRRWHRDVGMVDSGDGPTVRLRAALIGDGSRES